MQRILKFALASVHDLVMAGLAFVVAWYLRYGAVDPQRGDTLLYASALFTLAAAASLLLLGSRGSIWRYSSLTDLLAIVRSASLTVVVFIVASFLLTRLSDIPRSVPLIAWFIMIVFLGAPRLFYRMFRDRMLFSMLRGGPRGGGMPVLLFGAGDEADAFIRALAKQKNPPFRVVGIIDRRGHYVGRSIRNVPVVGKLENAAAIVDDLHRRYNLQALVITPPTLERHIGETLVEAASRHNIAVQRLPDITRFQPGGNTGPFDLEPIRIEDLLGRAPVRLDVEAISGMIAGRTVLVTGAGGSIGGELCRQIAGFGPKRLVMLDHGEFNLYAIDRTIGEEHPRLARDAVICSVRQRARIFSVMQRFRPDVIFHAAALKHVPLVEANPAEGVLTNVFGTRNVADAAGACGVEAMVVISTDKAINPTSVMGASKRIAESYCQALDLDYDGANRPTRFLTVRFGNVLGSTGSVVPLFEHQLKRGGPLTVTHPDIERYFMTIQEAVQLVLQASVHGLKLRDDRGKIFVLDMGQPVKIVDLARQMIRLSGLTPDEDIEIVFTGLRPGEKLFEELFSKEEPPQRTTSDGVMVASPRLVDRGVFERALKRLEEAALKANDEHLRAAISELVPDFASRPQPQGRPDLRIVASDG